MAAKIEQGAGVDKHCNQAASSPASTPLRTSSNPKVVMRSVKAGVNFVIPKNKLSGSLVPVNRKGGKIAQDDAKKDDDMKQPQRKTKWGFDLSQDTAVRRGRALAYQTRVEQITAQLEAGDLDDLEDDMISSSPPVEHDVSGQRTNTKEARRREQLDLERREAIGECLRLNPNYKPPPGYIPVYKEAKFYIPVKEYPGFNFVGLISGPEGKTRKRLEEETGTKIVIKGELKDADGKVQSIDLTENNAEYVKDGLHVHISAETYEKVDAAIALLEMLMTSVEGNIAHGSGSVPSSGDTSKSMDTETGYSLHYNLVQSQSHSTMVPPPGQQAQQPWSSSVPPSDASGSYTQPFQGQWQSPATNASVLPASSPLPRMANSILHAGPNTNMYPHAVSPAFPSFQRFPLVRHRPPLQGYNQHNIPPNARNALAGPVDRPQPTVQSQQGPFMPDGRLQNPVTPMTSMPVASQQLVMGGRPQLSQNLQHTSTTTHPSFRPPQNIGSGGMGPVKFNAGMPSAPMPSSQLSSGPPPAFQSTPSLPPPSAARPHVPFQPPQVAPPPSRFQQQQAAPQQQQAGLPPPCFQQPQAASSHAPPIQASQPQAPLQQQFAPMGMGAPSPRQPAGTHSQGSQSPSPHILNAHPGFSATTQRTQVSGASIAVSYSITCASTSSTNQAVQGGVPPVIQAPGLPSPGLSQAVSAVNTSITPLPQSSAFAAVPSLTAPVAAPPSHPPAGAPSAPRMLFVPQRSIAPAPAPAPVTVVSMSSSPMSSSADTNAATIRTGGSVPTQSLPVNISAPLLQASGTMTDVHAKVSDVPVSIPNARQPQPLSSGDFTFQPQKTQPLPHVSLPQPSQSPFLNASRSNQVGLAAPQAASNLAQTPIGEPRANTPTFSGEARANTPPFSGSAVSLCSPAPPVPPLPPQAPSYRPALPSPPRPFATSAQPIFTNSPQGLGSQRPTGILPPQPTSGGASPLLPPRPPHPVPLRSHSSHSFSSTLSHSISSLPPQLRPQRSSESYFPSQPLNPKLQMNEATLPPFPHLPRPSIPPAGLMSPNIAPVSVLPSVSDKSNPSMGPTLPHQTFPVMSQNILPQSNSMHQNQVPISSHVLTSNQRASFSLIQNQGPNPNVHEINFGHEGGKTLSISKAESGGQSYDPFSPTSEVSELVQSNQKSEVDDKTVQQHTDPDYENLMESVGVK
eukprot:TRINITY_DN3845_c0_g1_i2.p1 TRINITY_DN3845_c0_g1~~TRINITY_DN3845_c0_g1_i2.p1  ORF type:complete len:1190 (-),score=300.26 TRINITY_DN3845_c0_g1_i2:510-4079(-)